MVPRPLHIGVGELEVVEDVEPVFEVVELVFRAVDEIVAVPKDEEFNVKDVRDVAISVVE